MYFVRMKLTLNIDGKLLDRVQRSTGARTKTEAIHNALREMDRRYRLIEVLRSDEISLTPEELANAWEDPGVEELAARAAEERAKYATKPRSRR
ncbi:MAG: Bacterial antitoxin of type system, VapB [Verrucomicrobiota bacterium]